MKILFFSPYFDPYTSGLTILPFKILIHLGQKNQVTVLTFPHQKNLKRLEKTKHLNIIRMPYLFRLDKGFISPQAFAYFFKHAPKADLIINNLPNFEGLILPMIGRLYGKRVISIFLCHLQSKNIYNKIVNFFANSSTLFQLIFSTKVVVLTKDYIESLFINRFIKNKIAVCLPPLEISSPDKLFFNKLSAKKNKKYWIGYVGRIAQEKGLEYLVEAIKNLKNNLLTLVFAGPYGKEVAGENRYFKKIKKLLETSGAKYLFLGKLTNGQLAAFYKAMDLLVLPSINQTEAFGMVQAEAMMTGTPVVASSLPGVRVPINLTKMGLLVEPKNVKELAWAIKTVLKNRHRYTSVSLVKDAQTTFDIKKVFQFYDDLFHKKIS